MDNETQETKSVTFRWICPHCNKPIESLYVAQLESNKKEHLRIHEAKKEEVEQ